MERMLSRILLAATAAALILPAAASAEDICVGDPAGCSGDRFPAEELAAALFAAEHNGTADRVVLGRLDEEIPPIAYSSAEPLEVAGAGAAATVLRFKQPGHALDLASEAVRLSGFTVRLSDEAEVGLTLDGATAEDVAVEAAGAPDLAAAVVLQGGGSLLGSRVTLDSGNAAIVVAGGRGTVADTTVDFPAGLGIVSAGTELSVARSHVHARGGVIAARGHAVVADSLIDLRGVEEQGIGVGVSDGLGISGTHIEMDAERLTIVGDQPASADFAGVAAAATKDPTEVEVHVRDSVITGLGAPLVRAANDGVAHIDADNTAHPDAVDGALDEGVGEIDETGRIAGAPLLDAALHPRAGSPLIDAARATSEARDAAGAARVVDGDGDCAAKADVGALELQAAPNPACAPKPQPGPPAGEPAPAPDAAPVLSRLRVRHREVRFRLSEAATVKLRIRGQGRTRRVKITAPAGKQRIRLPRGVRRHAGRYKVRAVAIDSAGQRSAPRIRGFRIR